MSFIRIIIGKPTHYTKNKIDGTMKLIDFRVESSNASGVITLGPQQSMFKHDSDEKVSDLQFNPSPTLDKQFASGSETGLVSVLFNSIIIMNI
jgi:hypothetical protein